MSNTGTPFSTITLTTTPPVTNIDSTNGKCVILKNRTHLLVCTLTLVNPEGFKSVC